MRHLRQQLGLDSAASREYGLGDSFQWTAQDPQEGCRQSLRQKIVATLREICAIIGRIMETSSLDLLYLESDPRTKQPSACICTKTRGGQDYAGVKAERLVSAQCLNFIELDGEIRRLHAELDELRARAKKNFYRAFSSAASA